MTTSLAMLDRYFAAFNKHDPKAVAALFGASGTYIDPAVSSGVRGSELEEYLRHHYAAFPDARYEIRQVVEGGNGPIACEWSFTGTRSGVLGNAAPARRAVSVPGASLLQAGEDTIAWLHGSFDRRSMLTQLAL